jgi:hypothetical protein
MSVLNILRNPEISLWYNAERPYSPGLGNESDTYVRFIQKPFFHYHRTGETLAWNKSRNAWPDKHFRALKPDDFQMQKIILTQYPTADKKTEEFEKLVRATMEISGISQGDGVFFRRAFRRVAAEFDFLKQDFAEFNESHSATGGLTSGQDTKAPVMEIQSVSPDLTSKEINDRNRTAGFSYRYDPNDTDYPEDADSDDEDYHLYANVDTPGSNWPFSPISENEHKDVEVSDEKSYFHHDVRHVASSCRVLNSEESPPQAIADKDKPNKLNLSKILLSTQDGQAGSFSSEEEISEGCYARNFGDHPYSRDRPSRLYLQTLETIYEVPDEFQTTAEPSIKFDWGEYEETESDGENDCDPVYTCGEPSHPARISEQAMALIQDNISHLTKDHNNSPQPRQAHNAITTPHASKSANTTMSRFDTAYDTAIIKEVANYFTTHLISRLGDYKSAVGTRVWDVKSRLRPTSLYDTANRCAWTMIPLVPTPDKLYPPWTSCPGVLITNPEGEKFELEECCWDFSGDRWDEYFMERNERSREMKLGDLRNRPDDETYEQYCRAMAARQYWADCEERDESDKYWDEVHERARQQTEQHEHAAQDDKERGDGRSDMAVSNYSDHEATIRLGSMPEIYTERESMERRASDPEGHCDSGNWIIFTNDDEDRDDFDSDDESNDESDGESDEESSALDDDEVGQIDDLFSMSTTNGNAASAKDFDESSYM